MKKTSLNLTIARFKDALKRGTTLGLKPCRQDFLSRAALLKKGRYANAVMGVPKGPY